jgi:hypothetical protein
MIKKFALSLFVFSLLSFVFAPQSHAQTCTNTPSSPDSVTSTFSVPETNTYTIWTRLLAPDTNSNSIYVQIDGECAINVGDSNTIPANQFTWVNYQNGNTASQILVQLAAGTHTLKLIEREAGVGVDRVIITTNTACMPTGTGDNCPIPTNTPAVFNTPTPTATPAATATPTPTLVLPTNTPILMFTPTPTPIVDKTAPSVTITSPVNGSTVKRNTNITIAANASDNVAIQQVQFSVSGKGGNFSCTDSVLPYSCSWLVPAKPSTAYTITATAIDTSGNTKSASIQVTSSK